MPDFWDQSKDLERHYHPVTVGDVLKAQVFTGRLQKMEAALPEIKAGQLLKSAFTRINFYRKERHTLRTYRRHIARVNKNFMAPAALKEPGGEKDDDPFKNPFITWYANYYDTFASEYGWSVEQFNALPFASLNEFKLAISSRKVTESGRRVTENHPTKKTAKYIRRYARRVIDIPAEVQLARWQSQISKLPSMSELQDKAGRN